MSDRAGGFDARVVERTHTIVLNGEPAVVFPLFGPVREGDWVAGWEPEIVSGDGLTPKRGCVFRTFDQKRGETVWLLSDIDSGDHRITYVRTTPRSDLAEINIEVKQHQSGLARASITYRLVGLSEAGNRYVESFTEERYRELIDEWEVAINHFLETGEQLPTRL